MKLLKKIIAAIFVLIVISVITTEVIGPYLRSLKYEEVVSIEVAPMTYDCADGNCIAFLIKDIKPEKLSSFKNKLVYPCSDIKPQDLVESEFSELLSQPEKEVCFNGELHRFSVDTMRFFQVGYGGYKFSVHGQCEVLPKDSL